MSNVIRHGDINHREVCHYSRESGNPERTWIPEPAPDLIRGQARNDERGRTYVVMSNIRVQRRARLRLGL
jgi:hypothetical protein